MKGYLRVRPLAEIEREIARMKRGAYDRTEFLIDTSASPEAMGWIPLTAAIKQGSVLKVSAVKNNTHFEACFDMATAAPRPGKGTCEIRGGPLACVGTFVEATGVVGSLESKMSFVGHSSSGDGRGLLKWEIVVIDFVDADKLPIAE